MQKAERSGRNLSTVQGNRLRARIYQLGVLTDNHVRLENIVGGEIKTENVIRYVHAV
jgi:hypothetical protein